MRISDWSSDVCSSDLQIAESLQNSGIHRVGLGAPTQSLGEMTHLLRIDAARWQAGSDQRKQQIFFMPAAGFKYHPRWLHRQQPSAKLGDPKLHIGKRERKRDV